VTTTERPIGLALGGGAALGFAHVKALQAFDELGLKPSIIAGTSMGAIMGAFYAAGFTGAEIETFLRDLRHRRRELANRMWKVRPRTVRNLFGPLRSTAGQLSADAVLLAFGDRLPRRFEDLKIPLTVVATDYYGWRETVFSSGSLIKAVAASMAIPFIFRPVVIDGRPLVDGGVVNPLPFEHAMPAGGVSVAIDLVLRRTGEPLKMPRRLEALVGSAMILMHAVTDEKLKRIKPDILIEPPIEHFGGLEFGKVEAIIDAAEPSKDDLKRQLERILA
jgi:NTE family protein